MEQLSSLASSNHPATGLRTAWSVLTSTSYGYSTRIARLRLKLPYVTSVTAAALPACSAPLNVATQPSLTVITSVVSDSCVQL